jgi:hypothetical protein
VWVCFARGGGEGGGEGEKMGRWGGPRSLSFRVARCEVVENDVVAGREGRRIAERDVRRGARIARE